MKQKVMIDEYGSLAEKFIKKWFWLYFFSFLIGPIWYFTKIIISEELSVNEVWIIYWVISLVTLLMSYNDVWMSESLKRFIPKYITEKRYDKVKSVIFYTFFVQIITSIIICIIFYFWANFLAENYFNDIAATNVLKAFAFYFIWINIFRTLESFFISVQNTFAHKLIEFLRNIFIFLYVLLIFVIWKWNLINFSFAWIIWVYASIFISIYLFYKKYFKVFLKNEKILLDKNLMLEFGKYASLIFLWASIATVLSQIDMQMIIYILWTQDAWYYTNYLSIINIPFLLITPIFAMMMPIMAELNSKKENNKISLIKNFFSKNLIIIWIMFNLFFFLFSEIIAYTLFGEKFIQSWVILKYSVLFLFFNFIMQINLSIITWVGIVKETVKITVVALLFNICTNIILINLIWVSGAALATWIWWVLIFILQERALGKKLWKEYKLSLDYKPIIKNLFVFLIIASITYLFVLWPYSNFTRIQSFFLLGLCFFVWLIFFVISNFSDVKWFMGEIKKLKN